MTFYEKVERQIERRKARALFWHDLRLFSLKCLSISLAMYVVLFLFY